MSTRCTTHFQSYGRTEAIIYRHTDGYPEGAGKDIAKFLVKCKQLPDSRLTDPSYLAAKYVVFLASMFSRDYKTNHFRNKLDFISVGVVSSDPEDIEYRYTVNCDEMNDGLPVVTCEHVQ
jgi:hypothetical protein